jgi:hypothetical protein
VHNKAPDTLALFKTGPLLEPEAPWCPYNVDRECCEAHTTPEYRQEDIPEPAGVSAHIPSNAPHNFAWPILPGTQRTRGGKTIILLWCL